ncbi:hypothetical protein NDU88_002730 [Pleurodeles waltl]|uniref:Uncharacterized protein n=1 Tax=Pleurodeles waltl TaxID=8319 RepID=A0AAV7TLD7_PLEWA|nr:hypothetical protein NDU88_002730 [Pleurodeles waltl]
MATSGSSAAEESGACSSGSPPVTRKFVPWSGFASVLITVAPGAKWEPGALVPLRSLGLVVQALPKSRGSSSCGAGLQRPYHRASGREMATGDSSAAKESGACISGSPQSQGSSSSGAGLQRPYHSASGREMATGGSSAAKESEACSSGAPPSHVEV